MDAGARRQAQGSALRRHSYHPSKGSQAQAGQAAVLSAILLSLMALFTLGLLEYMTTNAQVQEAVAIADLAAHAGAMEIAVRPSGEIYSTGEGAAIAERYFRMQAPSHVRFGGVSCHGEKSGLATVNAWAITRNCWRFLKAAKRAGLSPLELAGADFNGIPWMQLVNLVLCAWPALALASLALAGST